MQLSPARSESTVAPRLAVPSVTLLAVLLAIGLALAAGGLAVARGFDGLYGQDAYAYFDYGVGSMRHSILQLAPLDAFFWPPGYPLLVALTSFVVGAGPLAGQVVSLAMGALVPLLTVLLARELFPEDAPLAVLAGAVAAVSGQLWQSSIVVMADTSGLALASFSALALVRAGRAENGWWLVAASAALALATLSRWIYGLVALPLVVYGGSTLVRSATRPNNLRGQPRRGPPLPVAALLGIGVYGLMLIPIVGPALVGLLSHPSVPAAFAGNFQVYSWSPLNAVRHDFITADGHLQYALPNGVYYAIAPANLAFFGPLLAVWALVGLWSARRWPAPAGVLIAGWVATVYTFHAGAPWQNFRFALAYLPPLAILVAAGVRYAWRWRDARLRAVVGLCLALGLLSTAANAVRVVEGFVDRKNDELALVRWVRSAAPAGAQLFSFGPTLAFRHYSSLDTFDLYDIGPSDIGGIVSKAAPTFLLLDESSVEDQWLNQAPSTNFHFLRDGPGLTLLGREHGYTLYRVGTG